MTNPRAQFRRFWPLAIVLLGLLSGGVLLWTAPETQPEDKVRAARMVQTLQVSPTNEPIRVSDHGTVIPARQVVMRPEVRGRVIRQHPALVPGGYLPAGAELIQIDPAEYELALTEHQTALEEARFELDLEKGRQVVAAREWGLLENELMAGDVNRALVLREPHLRRTEAMLRKATNEIAKARLNLSRTTVTAPFNAMVLEESVEIGQLVEPGSQICTLVGTDEFWVRATVPVGMLKWIRLPRPDHPGSAAEVILDTGNGQAMSRRGTVIRLLSDLDPIGRMARVLVRVPDPLGLQTGNPGIPLLLESYVRVEMEAGELRNVLNIPRSVLREGERIWVVDSNNELQIRPVEILWPRGDRVLIANCLHPGEQLVVSGLKTALPGLKVDPQPLSGTAPDEERGDNPQTTAAF